MNLPNAITMLRIVLVPVLIYLIGHGSFGAALWVFIVAGASDLLDGFIAKRFNLCTRLGAVLDPLADKLLVVSSVLLLALLGRLPWWLAAVIVLRDLVITGGALAYYLRAGSVEIDPSFASNLNTFVQLGLIGVILLREAGMVHDAAWRPFLYQLALATTLFSGVHYVVVWTRRTRLIGQSR